MATEEPDYRELFKKVLKELLKNNAEIFCETCGEPYKEDEQMFHWPICLFNYYRRLT
jgi:rubrerythrin